MFIKRKELTAYQISRVKTIERNPPRTDALRTAPTSSGCISFDEVPSFLVKLIDRPLDFGDEKSADVDVSSFCSRSTAESWTLLSFLVNGFLPANKTVLLPQLWLENDFTL